MSRIYCSCSNLVEVSAIVLHPARSAAPTTVRVLPAPVGRTEPMKRRSLSVMARMAAG
jgi:hypothetical protein